MRVNVNNHHASFVGCCEWPDQHCVPQPVYLALTQDKWGMLGTVSISRRALARGSCDWRAVGVSQRFCPLHQPLSIAKNPRAHARDSCDLISRRALARGSRDCRRAVGVSQRVLSVALAIINRQEPRAHAHSSSDLITRRALARGSSDWRRAVGVSQRVLSVALTIVNRQEPARSHTVPAT